MRSRTVRQWKAAVATLGVGVLTLAGAGIAAGSADAAVHPATASPVRLTVNPNPIKIAGEGNYVSFALHGAHLAVDTTYSFSAPGLVNACKGTPAEPGPLYYDFGGGDSGFLPGSTADFSTDSNGRFGAAITGDGCVPGNYTINIVEQVAPFYNHTVNVQVQAAGSTGGSPRTVVNPPTVTLTRAGNASFTFLGRSLPAGVSYAISSPALGQACSGGDPSDSDAFDPQVSDNNGNFDSSLTGSGCVPGTYRIFATQNSAPYAAYSTTVTFAAPNTTSNF